MRLLLANSNISPRVTAAVLAEAERSAAAGTTVRAAHARFGAEVVGTRSEAAIAGHGLLDLLAAEAEREGGEPADAVLLAMSFDTGLWAAREMLAVPVVGMTEAACLLASTLAPRFGLVALAGGRGVAPVHELVASYGLSQRIAGIAAVDTTPQALLEAPERAHALIVEAASRLVRGDGAEAIVLIGAVMAGLPRILQASVPVPMLDGIRSGVLLAETLARLAPPRPAVGSLQPPGPRVTGGLSAELAARLAGQRARA